MKKQYQLVSCPKVIFRAYDIRGVVDKEISENVYFTLGFAIAEIIKPSESKDVCIAIDGRLTSEAYLEALEQGLLANGANPVRLGLLPTPLMYFAAATKGFRHGLMITGSHNPKNYNGLKIILNGLTLKEDGILEIANLISKLAQNKTYTDQEKSIPSIDVASSYIDYIVKDIKLARPLKVVFDYGNGAGAAIGPELFRSLGCEAIDLNGTVDGHFPAHHPDPSVPENLVELQRAVKDCHADVGLAFDGDADRVGVIAPSGEIIWPDRLMMIFAQALLRDVSNATIVYDVKCTRQLTAFIEGLGGRAIMSPTGHSLVKSILKTTHADLAGEMSGHVFFQNRWFGFDDGIYSACRFLEILSQYPSMDVLLATLPEKLVSTPELKIYIPEDQKFDFMQQFMAKAEFAHAKRIEIDGLRVEYENAWGLIRASNTSPNLIARFEANSETELADIKAKFREEIFKINAQLELSF
jgi:phosphomannomutase